MSILGSIWLTCIRNTSNGCWNSDKATRRNVALLSTVTKVE